VHQQPRLQMFHRCSKARTIAHAKKPRHQLPGSRGWARQRQTVVNRRRRLGRRRPRKSPDPRTTRNPGKLERNTGFEPATFALATRQSGIHDPSRLSTNLQEATIFLGSSDSASGRGSTNLHEDSRGSCAQRVPRSRRSTARPSLDVMQVAALLGCSTAHVYLLCEQGKLPHSRDIRNAIRFDCEALGRVLRSTVTGDA
jgi:predicted DNA-binding transcriptional regulator AlpA